MQKTVEDIKLLPERLIDPDELLGIVVDVAPVVVQQVHVLTRARVGQRHVGEDIL